MGGGDDEETILLILGGGDEGVLGFGGVKGAGARVRGGRATGVRAIARKGGRRGGTGGQQFLRNGGLGRESERGIKIGAGRGGGQGKMQENNSFDFGWGRRGRLGLRGCESNKTTQVAPPMKAAQALFSY